MSAPSTPAGPVVIKLGGEVVQGPHMPSIAADVAEMLGAGVPVVLVHGGGPQATDLQKKLGQTPKIVGGRRVTDAETLDVMKMIVAGKMNVDLCAALVAAGARPVGLHGASACTVRANRRPPKVVTGGGPDPVDFGFVGDVVGVNGELIALLSGAGYVPAIACLGADESGAVYNINADAVANQVAIRLDARALVLVTDVPGVLRDIADPSSRIGRMTIAEGQRAIDDGVVTKGMIPKLEESFAAIAEGVRAVHIVGRLERGQLQRAVTAPGSVGTVLVA
ncbi:MAG TPA: acetylglutamate kinase [Labilithrix sp.]|nr:acetylglutamate kinase [Labilithrix sp.]